MQAFAVAAQSMQAHCTTVLTNDHQLPPALPYILSDARPGLPDIDSIPAPQIQVCLGVSQEAVLLKNATA